MCAVPSSDSVCVQQQLRRKLVVAAAAAVTVIICLFTLPAAVPVPFPRPAASSASAHQHLRVLLQGALGYVHQDQHHTCRHAVAALCCGWRLMCQPSTSHLSMGTTQGQTRTCNSHAGIPTDCLAKGSCYMAMCQAEPDMAVHL